MDQGIAFASCGSPKGHLGLSWHHPRVGTRCVTDAFIGLIRILEIKKIEIILVSGQVECIHMSWGGKLLLRVDDPCRRNWAEKMSKQFSGCTRKKPGVSTTILEGLTTTRPNVVSYVKLPLTLLDDAPDIFIGYLPSKAGIEGQIVSLVEIWNTTGSPVVKGKAYYEGTIAHEGRMFEIT